MADGAARRVGGAPGAGARLVALASLGFASVGGLGGCAGGRARVGMTTAGAGLLVEPAHASPFKADDTTPSAQGWARYFAGDRGEAHARFTTALEQDAGDPRALFGLATIAEEEGRFGDARELHARLLETAKASAVVGDAFRPALELAAAGALERLVGEAPGERALAERLAKIDDGRLDRDAASRLLSARAGYARRLGDEQGALALERRRGCPAEIATDGPYGHLPLLDLDRPFAPDRADGAEDEEAAARSERIAQLVPLRGCMATVETPQGRPGVSYATVWARASRRTTAIAAVSLDAPYLLLVDGKVVLRSAPTDRFPARTQQVELPLSEGWHRVSIKLSTRGPRTPLGLRVSPLSLSPSTSTSEESIELTARPPAGVAAKAARLDEGRGAIAARPHARASLERARAHDAGLATWLAALTALRDGDSHAAEPLVDELERRAPKFVPGRLLAAQVDEQDPSRPSRIARDRARRELSRALALDEGCVEARYELAQLDVQEDHADRALARLAAAPEPKPARVADASQAATAPTHRPWRLAFARSLALRARGFLVEAERALSEARSENPEACPPVDAALRLALDRHDLAAARQAAEGLARCQPESEERAQLARESGDLPAALAEYERLLARDPTRESVRAALGELRLARGDAGGAVRVYRELVRREPLVGTYHRQLADALLAAGDEAGAKQALETGLARAPESQEVRRALTALGEPDPIDAFRVDGRKVIAEFEASNDRYDAPAVIVLDRTVTRVFPTGARLTITHNIVRVQTKDGIDKWGEVQVPEGADVLAVRTVKADGTTREPEEIAEKQSISVPDLQPGDYVELEYVAPEGAPQAFPGGFYGERFYFQSFDAPLDRTEYVLVTPRGMEVQIDRRGPAPREALTVRGGLDVRTFADRKKAQLHAEPQQAPFTEYVPSVRAASGATFERWRDFLDDQGDLATRANEELSRLARELERDAAARRADVVDTVDAWVRKNIKQGGSLDEPATSVLARGEGSRVVIERALLSALGVPANLWLARARGDARLDGSPLPDLEGFDEALLAVGGDGRRGDVRVLDPRFRHAPTAFLAPNLRDEPALSLARADRLEARSQADAPSRRAPRDEPRARFSPLPGSVGAPGQPPPVDERQVALTAKLDGSGEAEVQVVETLRGWPALEWREALDRIPEDKVRSEFEQRTLGFYFPGATLESLAFEHQADDAAPLVVRYAFRAPRFARVEGKELLVPAPFPALLGKRYVGVAERTTPMQLPYVAPSELTAAIELPAGATLTTAAPPVDEPLARTGGAFAFSQSAALDGRTLRVKARFAMPPARVPAAAYAAFRQLAQAVDAAEARAATVALP